MGSAGPGMVSTNLCHQAKIDITTVSAERGGMREWEGPYRIRPV